LRDAEALKEQTIYVGDSKMKDIAMANIVGVTSVWAEYGAAQHRPEYQLLREVTHWKDEDVHREKEISESLALSERDLIPKFTLKESLNELLDNFEFVAFAPNDRAQKNA